MNRWIYIISIFVPFALLGLALLFDPLLGSLGTHFVDAAFEIFMERNIAIRRPFLQLETSDQAVYREVNRWQGAIYAVGYFSLG